MALPSTAASYICMTQDAHYKYMTHKSLISNGKYRPRMGESVE